MHTSVNLSPEVFKEVFIKSMTVFSLLAFALLAPFAAHAQTPAPAPPPAPEKAPAATMAPRVAFATTLLGGDNFLGVHPEDITRENMSRFDLTGEPRGVGVRSVVKGGPADRAGLRDGDVILRFDGEAVTSVRKLNRLIDEAAPEHTARLTFLRDGAQQEITVALGRREGMMRAFGGELMPPAFAGDARALLENFPREGAFPVLAAPRRIGVAAESLSEQLADYFGVAHGALISTVEAGSPAERAGLRAGDVVTEADGEQVKEAGDLSRAINRKDDGDVTLTVVRDKQRRTIRVTPERREPRHMGPGQFRLVAPVATRAARRLHSSPRHSFAPRVEIRRGSGAL